MSEKPLDAKQVFAKWATDEKKWRVRGTPWAMCGVELFGALGKSLDTTAALESRVAELEQEHIEAQRTGDGWTEANAATAQLADMREALETTVAIETQPRDNQFATMLVAIEKAHDALGRKAAGEESKMDKVTIEARHFDAAVTVAKRNGHLDGYRAGIEAAAKHMDALGMLHAAMAIRGLPDPTDEQSGA